MLLTYKNESWEFECYYDEKSVATKAGFKWDSKTKVWFTDDWYRAANLRQYADDAALASFAPYRERVTMSRAQDTLFRAPHAYVEGQEFLPFQHAGVEYVKDLPSALIADEMGLGKTLQGIGLMNHYGYGNVLIACQKSQMINWERELRKWMVKDLSIGRVSPKFFPRTNVVIINNEQVGPLTDEIDRRHWNLVIIDEAQHYKTEGTKRTQALLGVYGKRSKLTQRGVQADQFLFMTGTPLEIGPRNFWTIIRHCDPDDMGRSISKFEERYCGGWFTPWGTFEAKGKSNLGELQDYARSKFMVRRLKAEVLKQLPEKRRSIVVLENAKAKAAVEEELNFYNQAQDDKSAAKAAMAKAKDAKSEDFKKATRHLREAQKALFTNMAALRQAVALKKIDPAIEIIEDMVDSEKVVVFCYHRQVQREFLSKCQFKCEHMHGDHTVEERQDAVDRFQKDPKVRGIIGTLDTMYAGWTLTAGSIVIFLELDWRALRMKQAEDRTHRIGQTVSVNAYYLVFDGSLDARMAKQIVWQLDMEKEALDDDRWAGVEESE